MEKHSLKKKKWTIRKHHQGWTVVDICNHGRIKSTKTFYRWLKAYEDGGWTALEQKSRRPNTIHYKVEPETAALVVHLREKRGWGPQKIEAHFKQQGVLLGHTTIYGIIKAMELNPPLQKPRKQRTYKCWQRRHPNSLWQTDFKIVKGRYLNAFIDDASRFVSGAELFDQARVDNVLWLFEQAIHEYGKPKQVLTDHGSQFYSMRGGTAQFDSFCRERGIKHILAGVARPTTCGKIERWFGTYDREAWRLTTLDGFVHYYNYERPHMALDGLTPADAYFK